jgi:hypothetical protein
MSNAKNSVYAERIRKHEPVCKRTESRGDFLRGVFIEKGAAMQLHSPESDQT